MSAGRPKFSIRFVLLLVAASGITAMAMANASIYWASLYFSLALLILTFGSIAAIFRRGAKRAYWIGFLILGGGYMTAMYAPGLDRVVGHRLVTTKVLGRLEQTIGRTDDELDAFIPESSTRRMNDLFLALTNQLAIPQWGYFQKTGHSACAIVLACIGGMIAQYFFLNMEERVA